MMQLTRTATMGGSKGGKSNNKRRHQSPHDNNNERERYYQSITFHERPSSGRPGSPHRYFEHSYDVKFNNKGHGHDGYGGQDEEKEELQASPSELIKNKTPSLSAAAHGPIMYGNQVVHRHLNGLCIVTAGNVLERYCTSSSIEQNTISNQGGNGESNIGKEEVGISSIQYQVKVAQDSQSARGKLRTKNKKQKRSTSRTDNSAVEKDTKPSSIVGNENADDDATKTNNIENHNGNVLPNDPLCQITFTNGHTIQLNCCIAGTIIELNQQLLLASTQDVVNDDEDKKKRLVVSSAARVLLNDPLLDGHLAVIMPTRGAFPPK